MLPWYYHISWPHLATIVTQCASVPLFPVVGAAAVMACFFKGCDCGVESFRRRGHLEFTVLELGSAGSWFAAWYKLVSWLISRRWRWFMVAGWWWPVALKNCWFLLLNDGEWWLAKASHQWRYHAFAMGVLDSAMSPMPGPNHGYVANIWALRGTGGFRPTQRLDLCSLGRHHLETSQTG